MNQCLKNTRYLWLKNPCNLTEKQKNTLGSLKDMNLKTVRAYNLKLSLQIFRSIKERGVAEQYLKRCYFWDTHSRLQPMIDAAKTIKRHWNGILNYFESRITNGILEGINSVVQLLKRSARGYRNIRNFMTMIYLRLGHLDFQLPIQNSEEPDSLFPHNIPSVSRPLTALGDQISHRLLKDYLLSSVSSLLFIAGIGVIS